MATSSDVKSIFGKALELTTAQRAGYLDQACGDDAVLRGEVQGLLDALDKAGRFMSRPAVAPIDIAAPQSGEVIGTMIGPYKLLQKLGEGGMGAVYLAEQEQPVKRQVALKIMKAASGSQQVIARFQQERQALALMNHPNIAQVLDAGTTDAEAGRVGAGRPYVVMELVEGIHITQFCDQECLTPKERLELLIPVCHAVQHAHQKGIIHRDLKPSNVLIAQYDGRPVPKVIDFGVAKAVGLTLSERTLVTEVGILVGTLEYMAPEQADFTNLDIDTRADIYSLGVILYELLTGSPPFSPQQLRHAGFAEMLRLIQEVEPPTPSTRLSSSDELPSIAATRKSEPRTLAKLMTGELDWIVMKCLEKERGRRYKTADALALEIQRYLADEPVLAGPPSATYRLKKFLRRKKRAVVAAGLLFVSLLGGIIGTTWEMIRATDARTVAVNESKEKEAALAAAQVSEREAKDKLFMALLEQARAGRFSRQMGQRLDSLAALTKAAHIRPDERLRDEAIAAMALPDVGRVPVGCSSPLSTTALAFSGQYQAYARADAQGIISIRSVLDDQEIQHIASGPILPNCLYFSSDDQFLLGLGEGKVLGVWRVADGQRVIPDEVRDCWAPAFSPDSRFLAVGQRERVLCFDLATGQEFNRWALAEPVSALAFHPDSRKLAVGQIRATVVSVYDATSGNLLEDLPVGAMENQIVAWHPDGETLAVTGWDPSIQIWNVAAKRKVATLEGHVQHVPTLTFHPNGSLLASHSWDGVLRLWDPTTGRPLLQLPLAVGGHPRFSGDGQVLGAAVYGEQTELLEVTPSREYRTLVSSAGFGAGGYNEGAISPDGRLLAVAMDPGTRIWDLRSGRELAALPAWTNYVFFDGGATADFQCDTSSDGKCQVGSLPCVLTSGSAGLLRWPVTRKDSDGKRLILGPPQPLSPLRRATFTRSPDGRTLGAVTAEGGTNQIVDLETGTVRLELGRHPDGEVRALSGDGRWAASSGWHSDRVRLWNAETGQLVHEWVVGKRTSVFFTPDSRTLVISTGDAFSFWDVATFEQVLQLSRDVALYPGYVAFSPDGNLMAVEMAPATIHLKDVATGRTVAKLEDPHGDRASWQGFTPDGTQLVVVSKYATAIHIWDLRAIRTRLKEMNLDWDWPEFPPARSPDAAREQSGPLAERRPPHRSVPSQFGESRQPENLTASEREGHEPVTIEVHLGHLALEPDQWAQQVIEDTRRAFDANPDSARACNKLAWALATAPEALRNVEEAVSLAEKAVRLAPANARYRNTLGLAYYRAGRYREAVEILRPNLAVQQDRALAFDLYFLAMSHHQLGDATRARDYYDWAARWTTFQNSFSSGHAEELDMVRAEAEEVLGVKEKW